MALLYPLGFLSGFAAILYQTVWLRRLTLMFGSSAVSVGICLAVFMAGLGLGSFVVGRRADRHPRPERLYAVLEAGIGLFGLLSPLLFSVAAWIVGKISETGAIDRTTLLGLRFAGSFAILIVPTFLMGGTYPAAVRYLTRTHADRGRPLGLFYGINTIGAAAAAFLFPLALFEHLGLYGVTLLAAACNGLAAVGAYRLLPIASPYIYSAGEGGLKTRLASCPGVGLAFLLSGFAALALETIYNRVLIMTFGSSIYSFSFILGVYLVGIGFGGEIYAALERRFEALHVFAAAQGAIMGWLALTIPWMDRASFLHLVLMDTWGGSFAGFHAASIVVTALFAGVPAVGFGVGYPAALKVLTAGTPDLGDRTGFWAAVNGIGAFLGSVLATFWLLPKYGSYVCLTVMLSTLALSVLFIESTREDATPKPSKTKPRKPAPYPWARVLTLGAVMTVGIACFVRLSPRWDLRYFHSLVGNSPTWALRAWREGGLGEFLDAFRVREFREGMEGTVSVLEFRGDERLAHGDTHTGRSGASLSLYVSGKVDASNNFSDMVTQGMLAHLPMHFLPAAKSALIVGLGSGMTAGTLARYPLDRIDVVELSPDVVRAAQRYFSDIHGGAFSDRRVRIVVEDGRNFMAIGGRAYDLVISEPSNAWLSGASSLFTADHMRDVRRRLTPGGLFCQWFYSYSMSPGNIRTFLKTIESQFPHLRVFNFSQARFSPDILILASERPIVLTPEGLKTLAGPVAQSPYLYWMKSINELLRGYLAGTREIRTLAAGAPMHTDDRPLIELRGPRDLFTSSPKSNLFLFIDAAPEVTLDWTVEEARLPDALGISIGVDTPAYRLEAHGVRVVSFHDTGRASLHRQAFKYAAWRSSDGDTLDVLVPLLGMTPEAAHPLTLAGLSMQPVDLARVARDSSGTLTFMDRVDTGGAHLFAARNCPASGLTLLMRHHKPAGADFNAMRADLGRWFGCRKKEKK